jgi:hypothetical protein
VGTEDEVEGHWCVLNVGYVHALNARAAVQISGGVAEVRKRLKPHSQARLGSDVEDAAADRRLYALNAGEEQPSQSMTLQRSAFPALGIHSGSRSERTEGTHPLANWAKVPGKRFAGAS